MQRLILCGMLAYSLLGLTACEQLPLDILREWRASREHDRQERRDRQRLDSLGERIYQLVGAAPCDGVEHCRYIGLGAKPCGGPWEFLVYSTVETPEDELRQLVAEYNQFEATMNGKNGYVSDCAVAVEPALGCVEGYCVDLNVMPPPVPMRPLQLVGSLSEVEDGDPLEIMEVFAKNGRLVAAVGHSGGCEPHEYELWASKEMLESQPPIQPLRLVHRANGDMCEAYMQRELHFDLWPLAELHPGAGPLVLLLQVGDQMFELEYEVLPREEMPPEEAFDGAVEVF